jgi:hypothetical protein
MARFTSAYSDFILGLDEVRLLLQIAARKERKDPIGLRREINALCRAAIVLLSASVEAYIKGLGELVLDALHRQSVSRGVLNGAIFYHLSKDLLDEVLDARDPCRIADRVFHFLESDSAMWARTGPFPQPIPAERFNKSFANPAFNKVSAYFNRFGYAQYKRDLERRLKADFSSTKNMVDHLVDIRNKIAHGDANITKTPGDLTDMMQIIRRFGRETDIVFATWCVVNHHNIRKKT